MRDEIGDVLKKALADIIDDDDRVSAAASG